MGLTTRLSLQVKAAGLSRKSFKNGEKVMLSSIVRNCNPDRIYRINYVDYKFIAGRSADGMQVLIGDIEDELLLAIFFTSEGAFLRYDFLPAPRQTDSRLAAGEQNLQHYAFVREAKHKWMDGLGMKPGTIYIRHFAIPEWHIGIEEWPRAWFPEVQAALAAGKPLEDPFLIEWQQEKRWVMNWHTDFWMTEDGEVSDS